MSGGHAFAAAGRTARRGGWFAHRGGVSRCGQIMESERPSHQSTWRGGGHE
ncbi:hypothetical protein [Spongiactinospora sp. TRM90649]|uniref:hypothetical protein n=1 Tax=Spongiactinospora sp. TRM90649 TaxID=3031114 RepID=UPI0023F8FF5B|nr:hypothetical protein [Spongiactinospora sp. TRM90649]MDF5751903.1 hypothetical protein [Spongiactinospora sp. TRM90649]